MGIPYLINQHFYFADMIGIAPLPRDDDKALLSTVKQRKAYLKVHFNRNMAKSHVTLKPSRRDANVTSYPLLY